MMKMLISLDEERVLRDRKYSLADMWRVIDQKFEKYHCQKEKTADGSFVYAGNLKYDYYTCMGLAYLSLKKQSWFTKYCKEWKLYSNEDDEGLPMACEDLLVKDKSASFSV